MKTTLEQLSKNELLGLILHELPETRSLDNPVACASCGEGYPGSDYVPIDGEFYKVLFYVCDRCTESD